MYHINIIIYLHSKDAIVLTIKCNYKDKYKSNYYKYSIYRQRILIPIQIYTI